MAITRESQQKAIAYTSVMILTSTVTSFLCYYFGQHFLASAAALLSSQDRPTLTLTWHVFCLTVFQLAFCYALVQLEGSSSSISSKSAILYHSLAVHMTNVSLSVLFASSTAAIRMLEPLSSAFIHYVYSRDLLTKTAVFTLPCVVGGATIFVGIPHSSAQYFGIVGCIASNFLFGLRDFCLKRKRNNFVLKLRTTPQSTFFLVLSVEIPMCLLYRLEKQEPSLKGISFVTLLAVLSAISHLMYSFVSSSLFSALRESSVVLFHVVDIGMQTVVVLLLCCFGQRELTLYNLLGLAACTVGLLVFTCHREVFKHSAMKSADFVINGSSCKWIKKILSLGVALTVLIMIAALSFQWESKCQQLLINDTGASKPNSTNATSPKRIFNSQTFYHDAFVRPLETSLLPDLNRLPVDLVKNASWFLQQRLIHNPGKADFLSKRLKTSNEVIREAQRLHFNILWDLLKDFKYALWIDISAFENKGDSCVTVGETYFLRRLNIKVIYYCNFHACNDWRLDGAKNLSLKYSPDDLVVLGHGGGNLLGYYRNDKIRYGMIERFKNYKIIIFPQGIWIRNDDENTELMQMAKRMYCCVPNLTIVLRERPSFEKARRLFRGTTRLLMAPDIAFQVGPVSRIISPTFDIVWLKRNDREDPGDFQMPPFPSHLSVHVSEWIQWLTNPARSKLEQAHYNAANGHLYLQRGRVIITDRLHGHIFSILNDIPHVLIDPQGKKLTNYHYTWTASLQNVRVAKTPAEAMKQAIELLDEYKDVLPAKVPYLGLNEDFKPYHQKSFDIRYP